MYSISIAEFFSLFKNPYFFLYLIQEGILVQCTLFGFEDSFNHELPPELIVCENEVKAYLERMFSFVFPHIWNINKSTHNIIIVTYKSISHFLQVERSRHQSIRQMQTTNKQKMEQNTDNLCDVILPAFFVVVLFLFVFKDRYH